MINFNNKEITNIFYQGKEISKVIYNDKIVYEKSSKKLDFSVVYQDLTFEKTEDNNITTTTKLVQYPKFINTFINLNTAESKHYRWGEHVSVPTDML